MSCFSAIFNLFLFFSLSLHSGIVIYTIYSTIYILILWLIILLLIGPVSQTGLQLEILSNFY